MAFSYIQTIYPAPVGNLFVAAALANAQEEYYDNLNTVGNILWASNLRRQTQPRLEINFGPSSSSNSNKSSNNTAVSHTWDKKDCYYIADCAMDKNHLAATATGYVESSDIFNKYKAERNELLKKTFGRLAKAFAFRTCHTNGVTTALYEEKRLKTYLKDRVHRKDVIFEKVPSKYLKITQKVCKKLGYVCTIVLDSSGKIKITISEPRRVTVPATHIGDPFPDDFDGTCHFKTAAKTSK